MKWNYILFLISVILVDVVLGKASTSIDSYGSFNCASDSDNAVIKVTNFKFSFDRLTHSVFYTATGTAKETVNATAKITLTIYGIKVAEREVKFCEYGVSELCPITKNTDVTIQGNHTVPSQYVSSISELAFTIPDIEGNILIELYDINGNSEEYGCFRSDITNGKSTNVSSAKWGTAIAAIIALVVAMSSSAASQSTNALTTDGGTTHVAGTHAATTGATGAEAGHGAAANGVSAPASGPGTNVASNAWNPPGLGDLVGWLQTICLNGAYSISYPKVYRNFTRNFSWTCGVLEWAGMERSIDRLRNNTGGNLTESSYATLGKTTLYEDKLSKSSLSALQALASSSGSSSSAKRGLEDTFKITKRYATDNGFFVVKRESTSSIPTTGSDSSTQTYSKYVTGVEAYLEKNHIPHTNGFVTLLIWWAIIVATIIVFMLAFKIALELYYTEKRMAKLQKEWEEYENARNSTEMLPLPERHKSRGSKLLTRLSFKSNILNTNNGVPPSSSTSLKEPAKPKFQGFRKEYRRFLRLTLIRVIIILYGVWVLLSLYQFRLKDSWATIFLAALTFSVFTAVLLAYAIRIWYLAHIAHKKLVEEKLAAEAQAQAQDWKGPQVLFLHKPWITKYGVFYDEFKVKFWWVFIPSFLAVFGRNAFIALGVGHGLVQIFGQLAIDVCLCAFFCIFMPFNTKMGNTLNIFIQIVRVISLILTFLFTDVVSLSKIKSTIIGFVLIAMQSTLTVLLVLLILANACKGLLNSFYEKQKTKYQEKKRAKRGEDPNDGESQEKDNNDDHNHNNASYRSNRLFHDNEDLLDMDDRDNFQLISLDSPAQNTHPHAHSFDESQEGQRNIFLLDDEESEFHEATNDIFADAYSSHTGAGTTTRAASLSTRGHNIFDDVNELASSHHQSINNSIAATGDNNNTNIHRVQNQKQDSDDQIFNFFDLNNSHLHQQQQSDQQKHSGNIQLQSTDADADSNAIATDFDFNFGEPDNQQHVDSQKAIEKLQGKRNSYLDDDVDENSDSSVKLLRK